MAPIRVGIVGLSSNPSSTLNQPGGWGVLSHLSSVMSSPKYELVAVCNTSVASAQRVIEGHGLPSHVKPYGNVDDMAQDPEVELIVVSVTVAKHFLVARPALLRGKAVFVEWPLAGTLEEGRELAKLAREQGVRTLAGLQIRADPLYIKAREMIERGRIGKLVSSVATMCTSNILFDAMPDTQAYFMDWNSGGSDYIVNSGHLLHCFTSVVGNFDTLQVTMKSSGNTFKVLDSQTGQVLEEARPKTTPDFALIQGHLQNQAVASITFRRARAPVNGATLRWLLTGTEGEMEIVCPEGHPVLPLPGRTLRLLRWGDARREDGGGSVEEEEVVDFEGGDEPDHVKIPMPGSNTARLYEVFANGETDKYASLEDALETQELLHRIAQAADFR